MIFILWPGSCQRGGTLGRWGAQGVKKKNFEHGHMACQINGDDKQTRMQVKFSSLGQTGDLGERSKGQILLILEIFIPNFVCVLTNERYNTNQTGFSFCRLGHAPGGDFRALGVPRGSKKLFFQNMVMWHIKSTGMTSRTEVK